MGPPDAAPLEGALRTTVFGSASAGRAWRVLREDPASFEGTVAEELGLLQVHREEDMGILSDVRRGERERAASELLHLRTLRGLQQLEAPPLPPLWGHDEVRLEPVDPKRMVAGLYSEEALDVVREHVLGVIGSWAHLARDYALQLSLFQAGQIYAASTRVGYALQRVDVRYRLERAVAAGDTDTVSLRGYAASLGPEGTQRVAKVASQEAEASLERQVGAIFGDLRRLQRQLLTALGPAADGQEVAARLQEAIQSREVESVRLTVGDLRRLTLEGVAFGSLLAATEAEVGSLCELTPTSGPCPLLVPGGFGGALDQGDRQLSGFPSFGI